MIIRIKNLRVNTIIGIQDWERQGEQEVVVNLALEFDGSAAAASDDIADAVDYKALKWRIIESVRQSRFFLLERLAQHVLDVVMAEPKVLSATVEVDKPHALRFADSVSVTASARR